MMWKFNYKRIVELMLVMLFMGGFTACNSDEDVLGPGADGPSNPSAPSAPGNDGPSNPSEPSAPGDNEPSNPSEPLPPVSYYRPKTSFSQAQCCKVYEYLPAPGQFINETKTGGFTDKHTTQEAANAYAEERFSKGIWVSLGGFGGYVVVGFDHSIDNTGGYDFAVIGNSFNNSSEPGIVWVMQDENGDGMPNDTWYELRGCETGLPTTLQNYAVTYYRPTEPGKPVKWTDSEGQNGEIDYLKAYHKQDYYYPLWVESDSYTLTGTRLEAKNYDQSGKGTYWVLPTFDWGYADNFSSIDRVNPKSVDNRFKISDAMDSEGKAVSLDYIDFVKVQTGVNSKSGWLGEVSTEVVGFYDCSMK